MVLPPTNARDASACLVEIMFSLSETNDSELLFKLSWNYVIYNHLIELPITKN